MIDNTDLDLDYPEYFWNKKLQGVLDSFYFYMTGSKDISSAEKYQLWRRYYRNINIIDSFKLPYGLKWINHLLLMEYTFLDENNLIKIKQNKTK